MRTRIIYLVKENVIMDMITSTTAKVKIMGVKNAVNSGVIHLMKNR